MRLFFTIALSVFMITGCDSPGKVHYLISLNDGWKFSGLHDTVAHNAVVPGNIHMDLYRNHLIPHPYYGSNEKSLQWVGDSVWVYFTHFVLPEGFLNSSYQAIVFKGLDTYADVFLNGERILSANNMFREWEVPVKGMLRRGENLIQLKFNPAVQMAEPLFDAYPVTLPAGNDRGEKATSVFTRKAPFHYGWDWAPRFITCGIWQPVFLKANNFCFFDGVSNRQHFNADSSVDLTVSCDVKLLEPSNVRLLAHLEHNKTIVSHNEFLELTGDTVLQVHFHIQDPVLWWPHDIGDPALYQLKLLLLSRNDTIDHLNLNIGLRDVQLVNEKDSFGESFTFRINGQEVFIKGANVVPVDFFTGEIRPESYINLVDDAKAVNMNMIRIWGGGIYGDDFLYDLCDKEGILVWQDFMFACSMYPGSDPFLSNVKEEAKCQVRRLRNHPSLALFCGNNEISEGWFNWGWQKQYHYSASDSLFVWNAYDTLFHHILPSVVTEEDGNISYWPSSPQYGWGRNEAYSKGDLHYWGVWWGKEPFRRYREKSGRFNSEYGFQGFPDIMSLSDYMSNDSLFLFSGQIKNHQKHPEGFDIIQLYMERDYPVPDDLLKFGYVSQLLQAYGIGTAIEAHRSSSPYCMGTLYWQMNDCWPAISWSSIDYSRKWKALHYDLKRLYKNELIVYSEEQGNIQLKIINDFCRDNEGLMRCFIGTFAGEIIFDSIVNVQIPAFSSKQVNLGDLNIILKDNDPRKLFLYAGLQGNKERNCTLIHYFVPPEDLRLTDPGITTEWIDGKHTRLLVRTNDLAKNIMLYFDEQPVSFSDNYFDLLPDSSRIVLVNNAENSIIAEQAKFLSLFDCIVH